MRSKEIVEEVCNEMYKTIRNLRIRMKHEAERTSELNRAENELSTDEVHKLLGRMDASMLHTDHSLMVLRDFCG